LPSVVSLNAGRPRTLEWRGRTITTSIFKTPLAERTAIAGISVAGDTQSDRENHGGDEMAIYAYAAEAYAWWSAELGGVPLVPGRFGENLTTAELDVDGALTGERWRVNDVLLEVTTPRVPCYKLNCAMDDPAFGKRFADAGRPGAYLRIVAAGTIAAGDPIEIEHRPEHGMTIRRMFEIYMHDRASAAELLAVPGLRPSWRAWALKTVEG
jgi:MOSC domain-containing protein YiiM